MQVAWKKKLTSRKFWAAVVGAVSALLVAFGIPEVTIEQVISVVSAASVLVAYIIGEGLADAAHTNSQPTPDKKDE